MKKKLIKILKKQPIRFRFYKSETEKTEPNRKNRAKSEKTEPNRKKQTKPV